MMEGSLLCGAGGAKMIDDRRKRVRNGIGG